MPHVPDAPIPEPPRHPERPDRLTHPTTWVLVGVGALGAWLLRDFLDRRVPGPWERQSAEFEQVRQLVRDTHVRPGEPKLFLDAALHSALLSLDPYSRWYDRTEAAELERQNRGTYHGLGVLFSGLGEPFRVLFPLPASPAEAAGVRVGDRILEVAGRPVPPGDPMPLEQRLADANGLPIAVLLVGLDGEQRRVEIRPAAVVDPTVRHAYFVDAERRIAYLCIDSFSRRTPEEFDRAVAGLRGSGLAGLVLDLRANRGGVLEAATEIANRFVREGVLVTIETRTGRETVVAKRALANLADLPLVVLIDAQTASAAEVLAGALQDHRAAVLVGEASYGKGTVQTLTTFPELGGVARISTALYLTPAGRLIERHLPGAWDAGLAPDVELVLEPEERREIGAWLGLIGPPLAHRAALEAWEAASGESLIPRHPTDRHLVAALALLSGRRPEDALAQLAEGAK